MRSCHLKRSASVIPPFINRSLSLLLLSFNLCSRSVWGGLDFSIRGSGSEKMLVPVFFLSVLKS